MRVPPCIGGFGCAIYKSARSGVSLLGTTRSPAAGHSGLSPERLARRNLAQQVVLHLAGQLPEQHIEPVGVVASQRLFDALPVVVQIADLIFAFSQPYPFRYLCAGLNNPHNFMQNRRIHTHRWHLQAPSLLMHISTGSFLARIRHCNKGQEGIRREPER